MSDMESERMSSRSQTTKQPESFPDSALQSDRNQQAPSVQSSVAKMIPLRDLVPAAVNNVNAEFMLLDKGIATKEGQERTCLALVADETASVHFQMWGNECDAFEMGDIIHLSNGIFSYNRKSLVLRAGKLGKAEKVGEFMKVFVETPNMSEIRWGHDPNNSKNLVQEAVIAPFSRIFPPLP